MAMISRLLCALGRLVVAVFALVTSVYCLLAWIPFTYQQFLKGKLLPLLAGFAEWHPAIYWGVLAVAAATLAPDLGRRKTRWPAIAFLAVHAPAGAWLGAHPLLAGLHNNIRSYYWSLISLVPLGWLAAIDWLGHWSKIEWAEFRRAEDARIFHTAWQSAVVLSIMYAAVFQLRNTAPLGVPGGALALAATVLSHLTVLFGVFVGVNLARSMASLTRAPSQVEFALSNAMAGAGLWAVIRVLVFKPLSFEGGMATVAAAALAAAVMATLAGFSLRFWDSETRGAAGGLALAALPFSLGRFRSPVLQAVKLVGVASLACVLAMKTAVLDWNYLIQKLGVLLIWALTFSTIYTWHTTLPRAANDAAIGRGRMLVIVVLTMVGYRMTAAAMIPRPEWGTVLESYAGFDVSFRLIRDMLSPPPRDNTFYSFLRANTNIPRTVHVEPVDIELAPSLAPSGQPRPNIFVFVIDSLRRDYVSPYNRAVDFTPNLDAFARESVVFRNAFTHYGGTGLAEPSIWVGGMMLHQQYITPFYPMNALEKLIKAENYQPFVSLDTILTTVVEPMPELIELDHNKLNMDYDLCSTLAELETKLAQSRGGSPAFVYTQPQDLHISVMEREGAKSLDGAGYPGFYAPYASRLRRIDGCFGGFVQYLKARGLYDNSIVILTSDHGDSLGEQGRWGHAYSLVPDVVRIPLIVHVPATIEKLYHDAEAVTFSTDLTPTLYYLLGHPPALTSPIFGRPLFTATREEQVMAHRDTYLMAASYAAVYGILSNEGKSLFIADGVNEQDSYWEMDDRSGRSAWLSGSTQERGQKLIREGITGIDELYKFRSRAK